MTQVLFDAAEAIERLKSGGFSEDQARADVPFVREALEGGVATSTDVERVEMRLASKIDKLEASLRGEMNSLRAEMCASRFQIIASVVGASGALGLFLSLTG